MLACNANMLLAYGASRPALGPTDDPLVQGLRSADIESDIDGAIVP